MNRFVSAMIAAAVISGCGGGEGTSAPLEPASRALASPVAVGNARVPSAPTLQAQPVSVVNSSTAGTQQARAVGALADGGYVVTWLSTVTTPLPPTGYLTTEQLLAQRYDSAGAKVGGESVVGGNDRAMAVLRNGDVVTICCENQTGPQVVVQVEWVDLAGVLKERRQPIARADVPGSAPDAHFQDMKVLALADGGVLVAWIDVRNAMQSFLYTMRYDAQRSPVYLEPLLVQAFGSPLSYQLSADALGGYTVSTNTWPGTRPDQTASVVHYDVNSQAVDLQSGSINTPALVLPLSDGRFVRVSAGSSAIQFLDSSGQPIGASIYIGTAPFSAVELADGSFVLFSQSGSTVLAQQFDGAGASLGDPFRFDTNGAVGPGGINGPIPLVTALVDGGFAAAWTATGAGGDLDVYTEAVVPVLTNARKACLAKAKGLKGQERKAFMTACIA